MPAGFGNAMVAIVLSLCVKQDSDAAGGRQAHGVPADAGALGAAAGEQSRPIRALCSWHGANRRRPRRRRARQAALPPKKAGNR